MPSARFTGLIFRKISRRVLVCIPTYSGVLWFLTFPRTDPALVWSEFLGVISGSEGSLAAENGYMDRESYERLSHRTQATFSRQRGPVYSLFQAYIRRKRELDGYDVADRFV